jgi:hypothetical protein
MTDASTKTQGEFLHNNIHLQRNLHAYIYSMYYNRKYAMFDGLRSWYVVVSCAAGMRFCLLPTGSRSGTGHRRSREPAAHWTTPRAALSLCHPPPRRRTTRSACCSLCSGSKWPSREVAGGVPGGGAAGSMGGGGGDGEGGATGGIQWGGGRLVGVVSPCSNMLLLSSRRTITGAI